MQSVRLYDVAPGGGHKTFEHKAAVLDCAFGHDSKTVYSGGLDRCVKMWAFFFLFFSVIFSNFSLTARGRFDVESGVERLLGKHEKGVRNTLFNAEHSERKKKRREEV